MLRSLRPFAALRRLRVTHFQIPFAPVRRFLLYTLPPILWAAMILSAANDHLSSGHTAGPLSHLLTMILRRPVGDATFELVHLAVRRCAHLTEYGILSFLAFRALRAERRDWQLRWAMLAVAFVVLIASTDEWLQSRTRERNGRPQDVALDTTGALIAQLAIAQRLRRLKSAP